MKSRLPSKRNSSVGASYRWRCISLRSPAVRIGLAVAALLLAGSTALEAGFSLPNLFPFPDFSGFSATNSTTGSVSLSGPFSEPQDQWSDLRNVPCPQQWFRFECH